MRYTHGVKWRAAPGGGAEGEDEPPPAGSKAKHELRERPQEQQAPSSDISEDGSAQQVWSLPEEQLQRFNATLAAARRDARSKEAPANKKHKDDGADISIPAGQLPELARGVWQELGASEEDSEHLAQAVAAAAAASAPAPSTEQRRRKKQRRQAEDEPLLSVPWGVFEAQMLEAFCEVARQEQLEQSLQRAQQVLAQAGTGLTWGLRAQAVELLRRCVAADTRGDSLEALQARVLLGKQLLAGFGTSPRDLEQAEELLVEALALAQRRMSHHQAGALSTKEDGDEDDSDDSAPEEEEELEAVRTCHASASAGLAQLLLHSKRRRPAHVVLARAGFRYCFSPAVIAAVTSTAGAAQSEAGGGGSGPSGPTPAAPADPRPFVRAVRGALPPALLERTARAFAPGSPFWAEHSYQPDGTTPYFSYVHALGQQEGGGTPSSLMDQVIAHVWQTARRLFPAAGGAKWAEWWAHCRPHAHGHQLHFDSDNEGIGQVRNPIVSTVIGLSPAGVGGPTLVTPQTFGDTSMAPHGWVVHPQRNQLVVFDGATLHGVVPGGGVVAGSGGGDTANDDALLPFRVTLMVAFWEDIRTRTYPPGKPPGAAQPFPSSEAQAAAQAPSPDQPQPRSKGSKARHSAPTHRTWPSLFAPLAGHHHVEEEQQDRKDGDEVEPRFVRPVWLDVDAAANRRDGQCHLEHLTLAKRLPAYDHCFQGC